MLILTDDFQPPLTGAPPVSETPPALEHSLPLVSVKQFTLVPLCLLPVLSHVHLGFSLTSTDSQILVCSLEI